NGFAAADGDAIAAKDRTKSPSAPRRVIRPRRRSALWDSRTAITAQRLCGTPAGRGFQARVFSNTTRFKNLAVGSRWQVDYET
ncbi:hypothetical protein, partial [Mesorhizobium sp. M7D.F.Ca.US.004.03.1.1]|uniref:hypothetical protein n=1 Tax=Mesorhizobium sp. M7D.F.Ca.US.004.03.1.1 TaxID=2496702 RepID=UPI0019D1599A